MVGGEKVAAGNRATYRLTGDFSKVRDITIRSRVVLAYRVTRVEFFLV